MKGVYNTITYRSDVKFHRMIPRITYILEGKDQGGNRIYNVECGKAHNYSWDTSQDKETLNRFQYRIKRSYQMINRE